ncbi:MAG: cell division protein FtsA [Dehalococcoidales bacterium]|nr:cell division protein FtsA [Dehalococcoidales bacterium]
MKKKTITAIDVGTTKVCTAVATVDEGGGMQLIGIGMAPSRGLHKAMVVNIGEAAEAIRESVKKAEQYTGMKIESAYVGVTGRHVTSLNNKGAVAITRNDRMVRSEDLRRVLRSAQSIVKLPSDRKLIHVIPRNYTVDGQVGVKNPVGMHGTRLDVETHVITAAVTSVQNLVKCVRQIGIDVDDLVLEPVASSEAVLTEEEKHNGIILADIGGGTTDICIFREGSIWHTGVIPVAGYQLTRDIAIGLGIPFEVAEEMKKRYGTVLPVYEGKEKDVAVSTDSHGGVSHQDLCEILKARVEEILRLIILELPRNEYESLVPGGLVLTGGSSNLSGMATLGQQILQIPVKVGTPQNIRGMADTQRDPLYATALGMLLWAAKNSDVRTWKGNGFWGNRVTRLFSRFRGLFR